MEFDTIWSDYGFGELQESMDRLFPTWHISFAELMQRLFKGQVLEVMADFLQMSIREMAGNADSMKSVFGWLLALGILAALMSHFVEVFDQNQVADLSFYVMYLLVSAVLLKCFGQAARTAAETISDIVLFTRLLVPTYLLAVGVASGGLTAGAYYQLMLILICVVQEFLQGAVIPLIYSYCLLTVVNGVWVEEKLTMLIEFLEKVLGWIMKGALWAVTGISVFQSVLTPVLDSFQNTALQKAVGAIPGIGDAAEGVMKLTVGSAVIIKNSLGLGILILLLFLGAAPLAKIFGMALMLKAAAAFMGIVSDKRITSCTDRVGNGALFLFRLTGTVLLLFLITAAVIAISTNRGY